MLKKILVAFVCVAFLLGWLLWPIYQFYAHKGEVPFVPWGEIVIPDDSPYSQEVYNPKFTQVAEQSLQRLYEHHKAINAPGISAAVGINGKLVWAGAAGWADIELGVPVSNTTQFRVGSTSKAITVTGLARMLDKRLIDLEAQISQYHRALPNKQWQQIKVKHLGAHMSGLPHYKQVGDKIGLFKSMALKDHYSDVNDALEMFDESHLLFDPGSQFSYSSYGTVLLSAVMQEAAGQPFLELMQQQVFTPLELTHTGEESRFEGQGTLSKFYWNDGGKSQKVRVWRDVDLTHRLAGGGFVSTSSELVKLGNAYFDEQFISQKSKDKIWDPQRLPNGEINRQNYAIGWRVHQWQVEDTTVNFMHHGGVSRGAQSLLLLIPDYQLSLAININGKTDNFTNFSKIWKEMAISFIKASESEP
ncbi:serine hydrolase domain-containing protein [Paraglaciecola arctica]|uniref:serine hydrolase domain-containing protein n=1 Tax=Paraglaciecola arctica TaxID=1128911 RepID=UPI001C070C86|nr:serine hydrolase domain-containing protein [Paraglaciecola arctica]MBU3004384.1 beta-lactamase family protein [Paraglaciecola arctica]